MTEFTYSGFGEAMVEASPSRGCIAYAHDARGLVIARPDGRGGTAGYSCGRDGRLTGIDHPPGGIVFTRDQPCLDVLADASTGRISGGTIVSRFGREVLAAGPGGRAVFPGGRTCSTRAHRGFEGKVFRTICPPGRGIRANHDDDGRLLRLRLLDSAA